MKNDPEKKIGPEKRLFGVPMTFLLPERLTDLLDDEMRKLRLPSRSAMIRVCIEEYFAIGSGHKDKLLTDARKRLEESEKRYGELERMLKETEESRNAR